MPNFWERSELSGYLRDVRQKPEKYAYLDTRMTENSAFEATRLECLMADLRLGS